MKYLILLTLTVILLTSNIYAEKYDYKWSKTETALFGSYVVLSIVDVGQSLYAFKLGYYEQNPIFGKHPTREKVIAFKAIGVTVIYIFMDYVPTGYRKWFLMGINALQLGVVTHNGLQPGIGLNLRF